MKAYRVTSDTVTDLRKTFTESPKSIDKLKERVGSMKVIKVEAVYRAMMDNGAKVLWLKATCSDHGRELIVWQRVENET